MRNVKIMVFAVSLLLLPTFTYANGTADYLILQDIGNYKFITESKNPLTKKIIQIPGYRMWNHPGVVAGAGHFALDHIDTRYETDYESDVDDLGMEVQVTKHAGSDSDKWLLHEVEDGYRNDDSLNETTDTNVQIRLIDGNNLFFIGIYGGKSYTWINNNNIVVDISCSSCPNTKPEPLEIVKAYLAKYPSAITLTDSELKSTAHSETWIKDEMDRRLWLGGKWMGQIKTVGDLDKLRDVVKNLNVFLDYREKYYGIEARAEKGTLFTAQQNKDKATIEAKLNDYYKWWNENKDKPINLS